MMRKGFTLVELLVYLVIAAIIVGLAGQAFFEAARARLRTTRLLETTIGAGDIASYLQEDLRRIGAKASIEPTSSSSAASASQLHSIPDVYMNLISSSGSSVDSSSFVAFQVGSGASRLDSIEFRAAFYDDAGNALGWEQVRWSVKADTLYRTVLKREVLYSSSAAASSSSGATGDFERVVMAEGVRALEIRYGVYASDSLVYRAAIQVHQSSSSVAYSSSMAYLEQYTTHIDPSLGIGSSGHAQMRNLKANSSIYFQLVQENGSPSAFALQKDRTYRIRFGLRSNDSAVRYVRNDQDYIGVVIRKASDLSEPFPGTGNYQFYSALNTEMLPRSLELTPSADGDATLMFHFNLRSSASLASSASSAMGIEAAAFEVDSVSVWEISRGDLEWVDTFDATQVPLKRRVKAIQIGITLERGGAMTTYKRVIPIPNNGV